MKKVLLLVIFILAGCADPLPLVPNVTPFTPHISRSNAEIITRYKQARENGFTHGSAYQYARGDRTYTPEQLDVIGLSEMLNGTQLV